MIHVPLDRLLTHSRMKSFRACPRRHYYAYTLGTRAIAGSPASAFGSAVHDAIAAYWSVRASLPSATPEAALAEHYETLGDEAFIRARALVDLYCAQWDLDPDVTVLAIEQSFSMPLLHPRSKRPHPLFTLGGKIDLIVRLGDGRTALVEHKTTSSDAGAGSSYRTRLILDPQATIYFEGAATLGHPCDVCFYDVLVKPRIERKMATPEEKRRYKKDGTLYAAQRAEDETLEDFETRLRAEIAESPMDYFQRFEVVKPEEERAALQRDMWAIAHEIMASEEIGYPRRNPDACHDYGGCEYLPVCTRTADITDPLRYRVVGANAELQPTAA